MKIAILAVPSSGARIVLRALSASCASDVSWLNAHANPKHLDMLGAPRSDRFVILVRSPGPHSDSFHAHYADREELWFGQPSFSALCAASMRRFIEVIGDRPFVVFSYEAFVAEPEASIRALIEQLSLVWTQPHGLEIVDGNAKYAALEADEPELLERSTASGSTG